MASETEIAKEFAEKIKRTVSVQMILGNTMAPGNGRERVAAVLAEVNAEVNRITRDPEQKRRILEETGRNIGVSRPSDFPEVITESSNQQQVQNSNRLSDFINQMRNQGK